VSLDNNGDLYASSGNGFQFVTNRVLDVAFQNIGGTNYLTGDQQDVPFQWATLPV
jgi:hypothetical protein